VNLYVIFAVNYHGHENWTTPKKPKTVELQLVELTHLSDVAKIYSLKTKDSIDPLYQKFLEDYRIKYNSEIRDIQIQLKMIGELGARKDFFEKNKGAYGDNVCYLKNGRIRLFCIRWAHDVVIVGYGGYKPLGIKSWQEDPVLNEAGNYIKEVAAYLIKMKKSKMLETLHGVLIFKNNS